MTPGYHSARFRISERRAKLLGLDRPDVHVVEGNTKATLAFTYGPVPPDAIGVAADLARALDAPAVIDVPVLRSSSR